MAKSDNVIGIAMELDVSDLKAGLTETRKSITTANKVFQSQTAGMDDWTKTTEGLQAKLTQLDTVLDMQQRNLRGYEAEIKRVSELEGDHTEQLRKLNDKLLDAKTSIGKTEKAQRKYKEMLADVESETKQVDSATGKLTSAFKKLDNQTVDLKGGFTVLKGAMANFVSTAVTSLISGLRQAVDESRELRKETSRLETAFLDNGFTSEQATENFIALNSVLGDTGRSTEALQLLSTMADSQEELSEYTDILTGVYGKFGDSLPVESLAEAMNHTAKLGEVQGTLADALEWVGMNVDDFNEKLAECSNEEERAKLIRDTLTDTYGEASKTYKENNQSLIEAQKVETEYALAQAKMGEKVEPVLTTIKQGWLDVLNAFMDMMAGTDLKGLQADISKAFKSFIEDILPEIVKGIKWVIANKETVFKIITTIGSLFLAWKVAGIVISVVNALTKMKTVVSTVTKVAKALFLVLKANPIGLVITAVSLLVAGFIYLWNNCEGFREFWIGLWEKIKSITKGVVDWLVEAFNWVGDTLGSAFSDAWDKIVEVWGSASDWFSGIIEDIIGFFEDLPDDMLAIGEDMIGGLMDGINDAIESAGDFFGGIGESIVGGFKSVFDINSPSKVMRDEIGMMLGAGVGEGLLDSRKGVLKDAQRFSHDITAGLQGSVGSIKTGGVGVVGGGSTTNVVNNYSQVINAPKQPSRVELYRQTKNLLAMKGGY